MATHVYANDQEIACKAADGIASAAFPDPCWSPPPPKAGPILIPYSNSAFAKDITNGTTTVFITGKEVAIEDKAYFATSTGNEPATMLFKKGLKTNVIKGKAYFQSWSFDVIFEGLGVDRHQDTVSHNHGSMPSNTPLFPYLSRSWGSHECNKEEERIKRACAPEKDNSETRSEMRKKSRLMKALNKGKKSSGKKGEPHWTDDHCDGLEVKLGTQEQAIEYAKQMEDVFKQLPNELDILGALEAELKDMVVNAGTKAALKWGAKTALKQAAGSSVPLVGNVLMGIWSVVDGAMAIGDVNEIRKVATESLEQLEVLKSKLSDLQGLTKEFENFSNLDTGEQLEKAQDLGAKGQDMLATVNACTRARKCNLVPKSKKDKSNKVETADGKGCCTGQTGHHLIYGAMMEGVNCPGYEYSTAPTVCAEGTSQYRGSHGRVHTKMDEQVQGLADSGKTQNGTMSMDDTISAAVKSHGEAFPASRCKARCIRAQLEEYYKKKCPNARPKAVNKAGGAVTPNDNNSR